MRRPYLIGGVAALLLALAAGWYFASPWLTLRAMASAARANDADRLSTYVDYPALRQDVKAHLAGRLKAKAGKERSAAGRLGRALGQAMIAPAVDAAVSPKALKAAFAAIDLAGERMPESAGAGAASRPSLPTIDREGLSRFRVAHPATRGAAFVFERRGLGWKLAGIDFGGEGPAGPR